MLSVILTKYFYFYKKKWSCRRLQHHHIDHIDLFCDVVGHLDDILLSLQKVVNLWSNSGLLVVYYWSDSGLIVVYMMIIIRVTCFVTLSIILTTYCWLPIRSQNSVFIDQTSDLMTNLINYVNVTLYDT